MFDIFSLVKSHYKSAVNDAFPPLGEGWDGGLQRVQLAAGS